MGSESQIDITFFISSFNEESYIFTAMDSLAAAAEEVGCSYECIFIDDHSSDRSVELIKEYMACNPEMPIRLEALDENNGLGRNFIDAAFMGRGEYFRWASGDHGEPQASTVALLRELGNADIILPVPAEIRGRSLKRRTLSRAFTGIINAVSGYRLGYYNGSAIYRRQHLLRWHSDNGGFGFQADQVTKLLDLGGTIIEVGVTCVDNKPDQDSTAITPANFLSVGYAIFLILSRRVRYRLQKKRRSIRTDVFTPWSEACTTPAGRGEPKSLVDDTLTTSNTA